MLLTSKMLSIMSCRGPALLSLHSTYPRVQVKCSPAFAADIKAQWSVMNSGLNSLNSSSHAAASAKPADHNHSKLWKAERLLSASLLGLLPVAVAFPNPAFDYMLGLALTAHVHWGIEAIVVDYVRPKVVGETISKVAIAAVYGLSVFTLGGLFYFNYNDVGLGQAIRMLWKL